MHIEELHPANFLKLFFHPTTHFKCVLQTTLHSRLVVIAMRVQQLQQARHRAPHRDAVALVQVITKLVVLVDGIGESAFAHLAHVLRQIVYDQPILVGEKLRPHLGDFPARYIGMETVEEGRIDHGLGEWRQQMAGFHQRFHGMIDIADKHHTSAGRDGITATGKGT